MNWDGNEIFNQDFFHVEWDFSMDFFLVAKPLVCIRWELTGL